MTEAKPTTKKDLPKKAKVVIIGGGVGCLLRYLLPEHYS